MGYDYRMGVSLRTEMERTEAFQHILVKHVCMARGSGAERNSATSVPQIVPPLTYSYSIYPQEIPFKISPNPIGIRNAYPHEACL